MCSYFELLTSQKCNHLINKFNITSVFRWKRPYLDIILGEFQSQSVAKMVLYYVLRIELEPNRTWEKFTENSIEHLCKCSQEVVQTILVVIIGWERLMTEAQQTIQCTEELNWNRRKPAGLNQSRSAASETWKDTNMLGKPLSIRKGTNHTV